VTPQRVLDIEGKLTKNDGWVDLANGIGGTSDFDAATDPLPPFGVEVGNASIVIPTARPFTAENDVDCRLFDLAV